ncbi:NB-ARC domain-containing protein [Streptomyces sp. NPDC050504]|uniref:NB-ARC domain-containing protein n=1 Tax=Streptomyces sp. NPDC050504 TaxID=3365618 RepID=UPI00378E62A5
MGGRNDLGGTVNGPAVQAQSIGALTINHAPPGAQATAVPFAVPGWPPPRLLPAPTRHFTDRTTERARLSALAAESPDAPNVLVISGPGGIGKSAMAAHAAAALAADYDDAQLHADLRGDAAATALTPSVVLTRFLRALGVAPQWIPSDEEEQSSLFRSLTAGRRVLTVLDNAHSVGQVLPLIPTAPGSLTLVTSRHRLSRLINERGAHHIELGPLDPPDAERLLARIARGRDMAGAGAVARRCAGQPLALCLAAERVAVREHLTWKRLERELTADRASDAGSPQNAVADTSYADLAPDAARLYRLLALRPWPTATPASAAALTGLPERDATRLLEDLAEIHLVEEVAHGRYRFHDLIRAHAEQRALHEEGPARSAAAVRRLLRWYAGAAAAADACVMPGRWHIGPAYERLGPPAYDTPAEALEWLLAERENLTEAVRAAADYGDDDLTWQLCETLWSVHLRCGFHQDWIATHRLGVEAAENCPDAPMALGRMHAQLGFAHLGLGRLDEAEAAFGAAADADRAAGHSRGEATAVESLGLLRLRQRRYAEAADCFRRARSLTDDPRATALLEHHLGRALSGQEEYGDAVVQLERARDLLRRLEVPDPYNEARVLTSLGETALAAGDARRAEQWLAEAAERMAREKATVQQAAVAELRAEAADTPAERRRHLQEALRFHEATGAPGAARVRERLVGLPEG